MSDTASDHADHVVHSLADLLAWTEGDILAIAAISWPGLARLVRAEVLRLNRDLLFPLSHLLSHVERLVVTAQQRGQDEVTGDIERILARVGLRSARPRRRTWHPRRPLRAWWASSPAMPSSDRSGGCYRLPRRRWPCPAR